jgi:nitrogen fixation NifU-like protein
MYSPRVLDHFKNPRYSGVVAGATAVVECSNPVCGDVLQLSARFETGRLAEVRFKARGCVTSIACGSALAELLQGKTLAEAGHISAQTLDNVLGGLPEATQHASELAADTLRALLEKLLPNA